MTRHRHAPISLLRNTSNYHWHLYYMNLYNKTGVETSATMAMYYLFNHLLEQDTAT